MRLLRVCRQGFLAFHVFPKILVGKIPNLHELFVRLKYLPEALAICPSTHRPLLEEIVLIDFWRIVQALASHNLAHFCLNFLVGRLSVYVFNNLFDLLWRRVCHNGVLYTQLYQICAKQSECALL